MLPHIIIIDMHDHHVIIISELRISLAAACLASSHWSPSSSCTATDCCCFIMLLTRMLLLFVLCSLGFPLIYPGILP